MQVQRISPLSRRHDKAAQRSSALARCKIGRYGTEHNSRLSGGVLSHHKPTQRPTPKSEGDLGGRCIDCLRSALEASRAAVHATACSRRRLRKLRHHALPPPRAALQHPWQAQGAAGQEPGLVGDFLLDRDHGLLHAIALLLARSLALRGNAVGRGVASGPRGLPAPGQGRPGLGAAIHDPCRGRAPLRRLGERGPGGGPPSDGEAVDTALGPEALRGVSRALPWRMASRRASCPCSPASALRSGGTERGRHSRESCGTTSRKVRRRTTRAAKGDIAGCWRGCVACSRHGGPAGLSLPGRRCGRFSKQKKALGQAMRRWAWRAHEAKPGCARDLCYTHAGSTRGGLVGGRPNLAAEAVGPVLPSRVRGRRRVNFSVGGESLLVGPRSAAFDRGKSEPGRRPRSPRMLETKTEAGVNETQTELAEVAHNWLSIASALAQIVTMWSTLATELADMTENSRFRV